MFGIFKKKEFLKDTIPSGYVDIHSHTLFGIDDGAQTVEHTKYLLNSMIDLGFEKVITTPHTIANVYSNTTEKITSVYEDVKVQLPVETNKLSYQAASEYMIDEDFEQRVKEGSLLTIKDKMVLVEMSYINPPIFLDDALFLLISKGYTPILAHPERYNFYKGDLNAYRSLKKAGCKFQLNLLSTTGYYGERIAQIADSLLKENMYDFSGSDIHHEKHIKSFENKLVIKESDRFKELLKNNSIFK